MKLEILLCKNFLSHILEQSNNTSGKISMQITFIKFSRSIKNESICRYPNLCKKTADAMFGRFTRFSALNDA